MVMTVASYWPSLPKKPQPASEYISEEENQRLEEILNALVNLLSPLVQITSREVLHDLLSARASRFLRLKSEMAEILWTSLVDKEQSRSLYQQIREVVHAKSDLLGEEALHQLLGVIDSAEGLNELVIEANQKGGLAAYRLTTLMQEAGEFASYADMCANALIAVFTDEITDWSPDSILMLAEIADEYMTYVEDVFLARPHRDEERQDTVDFDSVRASLGL